MKYDRMQKDEIGWNMMKYDEIRYLTWLIDIKRDEKGWNTIKCDEIWPIMMKWDEKLWIVLKNHREFFLDLINYLNWQNNRWII